MPMIAPSNVYPTSDAKMILIAANQDSVFKRLAEAMGRAELAEDPRFATGAARKQNEDALDEILEAFTSTRDRDRTVALQLRKAKAPRPRADAPTRRPEASARTPRGTAAVAPKPTPKPAAKRAIRNCRCPGR